MATAETLATRVHQVQRIFYVLIACIIFAADQATKSLIKDSIPLHASIPVVPGYFNLTHVENTGMAFSLFAGPPSAWKTAILVAISVGLLIAVVAIWRSRALHWEAGVGLALILGGALSNLAGRIRFGRVTDFLDVYYRTYHWPTFNLADSAICVGAALLILEIVLQK